MAIKAVFFDGDGVLIDSYKIGVETHRVVAEEMGLSFSEDKIRKYWGRTWTNFLEKVWPGIDTKEFKRIYLEEKNFGNLKLPLVSGANNVLSLLEDMGYFLALITNRTTTSLWQAYALAGLKLDKFDFVYGCGDAEFSKPDARVFSEAFVEASKRGICGNEIIYVGDTLVDYEVTEKTDIRFVGVLTGSLKGKDFMKAGVKKENILKSIRTLPRFLGI